MNWIEPRRIGDLLANGALQPHLLPPRDTGVYVISEQSWSVSADKEPWEAIREASPLYVGGNTANTSRFRTRIGDLLADTFGFYSRGRRRSTEELKASGTGHHSGGISLNIWCWLNERDPRELYISWRTGSDCPRCKEWEAFWKLESRLLNKIIPPKCKNGDCITWPDLETLKDDRKGPRSYLDSEPDLNKKWIARGFYNGSIVELIDEAPIAGHQDVEVYFRRKLKSASETCDVLVLFNPPSRSDERASG